MAQDAGTRSKRWNLQVTQAEDALVRDAAELAGDDLTGFVRDAAVQEARRVLADRGLFMLAEDDWRTFSVMLDRPARVPKGLKDLFSKPSVFDE